MAGDADDPVFAQGGAGLAQGRVLLAEMDAVGVDAAGQFDVVVDQKQHIVPAAERGQGRGFRTLLFGRGGLVAVLQQPDAAGDGSFDFCDQLFAAQGGIGNRVDPAQAVI